MMKRLMLAAVLVAAAHAAVAGPPKIAPQSMPLNWSSGLYAYDGVGNIVSIGPNWLGKTDAYLYDGTDRLVESTAATATHDNHQTFTYDAYGNIREIDSGIDTGGPIERTAMGVTPITNRLTDPSICPGGATCVFASYDEGGNQTNSSNGIAYDFDPLGTMAALHAPLSTQRYLYDARGERIATVTMTPAGATTAVAYTVRGPDQKVLRTLRRTGATWEWQEDYVYRGAQQLAAVTANGTSEQRKHFHLDHLGTARLATDDRAYKVAVHTYLPFGQEAAGSDEGDGERQRYIGHERDFGGGPGRDLDYMHARYYAPMVGRFISADRGQEQNVGSPQSWNLYTYVLNHPIIAFDADGNVTVYVTHTFTSGPKGENPAWSDEYRARFIGDGARVYSGKQATLAHFQKGLDDTDGVSLFIGHTNTTGSLRMEGNYTEMKSLSIRNPVVVFSGCNTAAYLPTPKRGQTYIGVTSNYSIGAANGLVVAGDLSYIAAKISDAVKNKQDLNGVVKEINDVFKKRQKDNGNPADVPKSYIPVVKIVSEPAK